MKGEDINKDKDYAVGYKRPPVEHQFKKGERSKNPNGRPKLVQDFDADVQAEAEEAITVQEFGKSKTITKQRAFIKKLFANALNNNATSMKIVAALLSKMPIKAEDLEKDLSTEDAQILQDYIERKTNNGK